MTSMQRRTFLSFLSTTAVTPFIVLAPHSYSEITNGLNAATAAADEYFPQSIASGDPTESGFILWTRLAPEIIQTGASLFFEVGGRKVSSDRSYPSALARRR